MTGVTRLSRVSLCWFLKTQVKSRSCESLRLSINRLKACDILNIGNATDYGLAAGIHTRDLNKALRYARGIEAGQVYINGYHGAGDTVLFGGMKQSGVGHEKGLAALSAYYEIKSVTVTL